MQMTMLNGMDGNIHFLIYFLNLCMAYQSFTEMKSGCTISFLSWLYGSNFNFGIKALMENKLIDTNHIIVDSKIGSSGAGAQ